MESTNVPTGTASDAPAKDGADLSGPGISTPSPNAIPVPGKAALLLDTSSSNNAVATLRKFAEMPGMSAGVARNLAMLEPWRDVAPKAPQEGGPTQAKTVPTPRSEASAPSAASIPNPPTPHVQAVTAPVEKPPTPAPAVDQVAEAIAARAEVARSHGPVDFYMRLDPPDLGTVHVYLRATETTLSARLVVTNVSTRLMIERQLPQLRQKLGEGGLTLGGFDVSQQSLDSRQSNRQWQESPVAGARNASATLSVGRVSGKRDLAAGLNQLDVLV